MNNSTRPRWQLASRYLVPPFVLCLAAGCAGGSTKGSESTTSVSTTTTVPPTPPRPTTTSTTLSLGVLQERLQAATTPLVNEIVARPMPPLGRTYSPAYWTKIAASATQCYNQLHSSVWPTKYAADFSLLATDCQGIQYSVTTADGEGSVLEGFFPDLKDSFRI